METPINLKPRTFDEVIWYFDCILNRNVTGRELSWFRNSYKPNEMGFYTYHQVEMFVSFNDLL